MGPTVATTSNGATGRGYEAVVPVDGAAALTQNVTVTRGDLIKFGERAPIFTIAPVHDRACARARALTAFNLDS
jgi:hypothetical protein